MSSLLLKNEVQPHSTFVNHLLILMLASAFLLMLRDSWPRFLESPYYTQGVLRGEVDERDRRKVAFAVDDDDEPVLVEEH